MGREKIKIKKIDNIAARQVTFSKRRRGIFKKAEELAVLCDADVALVIFSATGKLFEYASSSMKDILGKCTLHTDNIKKVDHPSLELQLENINHIKLSNEVSKMTNQLGQLRVGDLQNIEELHQLEKMLEDGLSRVIQRKGARIMNETATLQRKVAQLVEENWELKHKMVMISKGKWPVADIVTMSDNLTPDEGRTSESATNVYSCNGVPPPTDDCANTSLKLGLPFN